MCSPSLWAPSLVWRLTSSSRLVQALTGRSGLDPRPTLFADAPQRQQEHGEASQLPAGRPDRSCSGSLEGPRDETSLDDRAKLLL